MSNWLGKHGPLLIAEIGGNHEGDFQYAKKLTKLAIESNADFIKFQLYTGDSLVSKVESEQRNQHFKKFELTNEQQIELAKICQAGGKQYMASVWNPDFIDWIDRYIPIYKIGSGDLTAYPVLKKIASLGKPIILSTGLATLDEVIHAIHFIQSQNQKYKDPEYLAVLQCTSMYPIEFKDANLEVMKSLKEATGLTIGYSDHTEGTKALEIAVALGAQILEFHFTDSREGKTFRDHKVSLTKEDVWKLIEDIENIKLLKGSGEKKPVQIELDNDHITSFRRAVYLRHDMKAGSIITESDLITLRPNLGIDAREYYNLIGTKLKMDVNAYHKLDWAYFENPQFF